MFDGVGSGKSGLLDQGRGEVNNAVESHWGHDMDEEACQVSDRVLGNLGGVLAYLVTLSREWNTIEFLHIAMATALFP